ncbi:restriction endonuclease subunit S [Vibrio cholerae]|nr:restriction endonuclease subunit S [Vibrio cholerae]
MSFDWPEVRLGDYIDSCLGKMLDKKKNKGTLQPYLGNSNVRWGNFDLNDLAQMKFEDSEHERYSLESGDLVVCEGGEPGRCAIWEGEVEGMKIQKALHRVRPNQYLNNYYLYYWFLYAGKTGSLEPYFTGTTIKHLTGRALANLPIRIPPLDIQLQCVSVLYSLDKKISHNIKTNQTLEEMAQAIFKSWFVDFDPVKAKMNGEQPEGMDEATASLFPEKLVESELGLVPEGWKIKPIKDLCTKVQNGGTPKRSESSYWDDGDIPWLTSGEVRQSIITSVENRITQLGLDKSSAKWVPELSTLVALYGATAGEVSLTSIPLTTNQAVCALMPKKEHQWYNYLQLKSRVAELAGKAVGSAQQNISKGLVESTEVLSVPESLLEAFNAQVENLFKLRICNLQENVELAKLRDTLLPKLLSGEIELGQAQELAEVE